MYIYIVSRYVNLIIVSNTNDVKYGLEMQNSTLTIHNDLLLLTDRLSDSEKILSKTNLGKFNILGNSL